MAPAQQRVPPQMKSSVVISRRLNLSKIGYADPEACGNNCATSMDLHAALKKHFGYDDFRPLQEEIITDALAGRDVLALMPTGGGKSICFQLPGTSYMLRRALALCTFVEA